MTRKLAGWIVVVLLGCASIAWAETNFIVFGATLEIDRGVYSQMAVSVTPQDVETFDEFAEVNYPGGPFDTTGRTKNYDGDGNWTDCSGSISNCIVSVPAS